MNTTSAATRIFVKGTDVKVGDSIAYLGDPIVVDHFAPYGGKLGAGRLAFDARGRAITVFDDYSTILSHRA